MSVPNRVQAGGARDAWTRVAVGCAIALTTMGSGTVAAQQPGPPLFESRSHLRDERDRVSDRHRHAEQRAVINDVRVTVANWRHEVDILQGAELWPAYEAGTTTQPHAGRPERLWSTEPLGIARAVC